MKQKQAFVLLALITPALTLGTGCTLAQKSTEQDSKSKEPNTQGEPLQSQERRYIGSIPPKGMQASDLIGAEVQTTSDEDVGSVNDLIVDENGQVVAVVVGVDGFLGMSQKNVAVGWKDVERSITSVELELRIDVTLEDLGSAPAFELKD